MYARTSRGCTYIIVFMQSYAASVLDKLNAINFTITTARPIVICEKKTLRKRPVQRRKKKIRQKTRSGTAWENKTSHSQWSFRLRPCIWKKKTTTASSCTRKRSYCLCSRAPSSQRDVRESGQFYNLYPARGTTAFRQNKKKKKKRSSTCKRHSPSHYNATPPICCTSRRV